MNKKQITTESYNKHAKLFAEKFDSIGARVSDIKEIMQMSNIINPDVFEIGCANGRDAKEILSYTNNYTGIDISQELINLAFKKVPNANFIVADIENFEIPKNLDIVFSFASLLHTDKYNLKIIFKKIYESLNSGGLFRLSLKAGNEYKEIQQEGEFGIRTFYFYSKKDIEEMVENFTILRFDILELNNQKWLEIILKK